MKTMEEKKALPSKSSQAVNLQKRLFLKLPKENIYQCFFVPSLFWVPQPAELGGNHRADPHGLPGAPWHRQPEGVHVVRRPAEGHAVWKQDGRPERRLPVGQRLHGIGPAG